MLAALGPICLMINYSSCADQPNQTTPAPTSFWTRNALFGSWDGLKPDLSNNGITTGVNEQAVTSNVLGGGARQGDEFAALLTPSARVDIGQYTGIRGLAAYVSAWVVQGHGPTAFNVHSLSGLAYVEAPDGARLADAYLTWHAPHDAIHLKVGKFGIDENFDQNPAAATLLNSNFTYRDIMANNLPGGGPAYSYEGPGAMLGVQATKLLRLRISLFSGDPLGRPLEGPPPPARDAGGLAFPLDTGALFIAEADDAYQMPGLGNGTLRVGGLYDTLSRLDLLFSVTGQSLAAPSPGPARPDRGEYVIYAGDTQTLWHGLEKRRLRGFARFAYAPPAENAITLDIQTGLVLDDPLIGRPDDTAALAISYDRISSRKIDFVRSENGITGSAVTIPAGETDVELDYNADLAPWLIATPDLQYIVQPGGGITDPSTPNQRVPNAFVAQLQLTITF
ncbi:carbohydrate porin [Acidiphilium sp. PA]|uniref:carbohydrate porin n=1 Tax=Acidiphilium sp. PA TaxID=2871705 RepID=UPI002244E1F8|nr:carbohydrate porin [Acidiphilium sp. PA]MCW8308626.1 carbohydrate porin [Acidiphilium sp. PA]